MTIAHPFQTWFDSVTEFAHRLQSRRRRRTGWNAATEVLESRILLTASVDNNPVEPGAINGSYELLAAGDFDEVGELDLFFNDPRSGENRFVINGATGTQLLTNLVPPSAINGNDFPQLIIGNFDGIGTNDLFFWNPRSGKNRLVSVDNGNFAIRTNIVDPTSINGNDFTQVVAGQFSPDAATDLFFWNPRSGRNRLIQFETSTVAGNFATGRIQTNIVQTGAINGNDFQRIVAGSFGSDIVDDLYFWNPRSGRNRYITVGFNSTTDIAFQSDLQTNVLPAASINGNDFTEIIVADFDQNTQEDFFFWNPASGRNRTAYLSDDDPQVQVENSNIAPGAINGGAYRRLTAVGTDVFFWSPGNGQNRSAAGLTDIVNIDPVTITEITPSNGEDQVNVARTIRVSFSRAIDPNSVTADSLQVTARGEVVPGRINVGSTGEFLQFFPANPLPASTEISVVFNGDQLRDPQGNPIDANDDGVAGGFSRTTFRTLPLSFIPGTAVSGRLLSSNERGSNGEDIPIVGATIRLESRPDVAAITDANGEFTLTSPDGLPAPEVFVIIDGSTATNTPNGFMYPTLGKPLATVARQSIQMTMNGQPMDIFLPLMDRTDIVELSETEATQVGFGEGGLQTLAELFPDVDPEVWQRTQVSFMPGSAQNDTGTAATRAAIVPVDPERLPGGLSSFLDPRLVISIQAGDENGLNGAGGATNFEAPAEISFPNLEGLAPGEQTLIFSFDHEAGRWIVSGTGTVSDDGLMIESDGGVIRAPGWHAAQPGVVDTVIVDPTAPAPDFDMDGIPDVADNDDDNDGIPDEDDDFEYEITVELGSEYLSKPFLFSYEAALDLPGTIFDQPDEEVAYGFREKFEYPKEPISVDFNTSFSFRVGDFFASFIEPETYKLFTISAGIEASVGIGFTGTVSVTGGIPRIDFKNIQFRPANGEIATSFELSDTPLCFIPFGIGNFICSPISPPALPLFGPPTLEIDGFSFPLDVVPPIDYSDGISLGFFSKLSLTGRISPTVTISKRRVPVANTFVATSALSEAVPEASESTPPVSTFMSVNATDDIYYLYELADGQQLRGRTTIDQGIQQTLPANTSYTLYTYAPGTNRTAVVSGTTNLSGRNSLSPQVLKMTQIGGFDNDGDGLPDLGEHAIGTSLESNDSDNDGITDFAELAQGTNPLDGLIAATGVIASVEFESVVNALAVEDDMAITIDNATLSVLDVSKFDQPTVKSRLELPDVGFDVALDSERNLAVVVSEDSANILDVSSAENPKVLNSLAGPAFRVEVFNGFAYVTWDRTLTAIDLETQSVVTTIELPGTGFISDIARSGETMFAVVNNSDTIVSIDLSKPEQPRLLGQLDLNIERNDIGLFADNGVLWVAGGRLRTIDTTDPQNMQLIASSNNFLGSTDLALNGSGLALVGREFDDVIEVRNTATPNNPDQFVTQLDLAGVPNDFAISRGIGYVAAGNRLQVVNYQAFDSLGIPPTVSISTTAEDATPAPGLQVVEGSSLNVFADVLDDVQVREVELLANGEVVSGDATFPFDLSTITPLLTVGGNTLDLQVRATDTGGNVGLSNVINVEIVPDTMPPEIDSISPFSELKGFFGKTVEFDVEVAGDNTQVGPPVMITIDDGVELTDLPGLFGSSTINIVNVFYDISATRIEADFSQAGTGFFPADNFNGYIVRDVNGVLPDILNVTIDPTMNSLGLTPDDVTFDVNTIRVNVENLPFNPSSTLAIDIEFTDDPTFAPEITSGPQLFGIRFSEAVDENTVNAQTFRILGSGTDGQFGTADDFQAGIEVGLRSNNELVQIVADLARGDYRLVINSAAVTDRSGNSLGEANFERAFSVVAPPVASSQNVDVETLHQEQSDDQFRASSHRLPVPASGLLDTAFSEIELLSMLDSSLS